MKKIIIYEEKCVGCKSCEVACAVAHSKSKDLTKAVSTGEKTKSRINVLCKYEGEIIKPVPNTCRHCPDAPCIAVCAPEALFREDENSPVLVENDKCIGCRKCIKACPYDAIIMWPDKTSILKCDLCVERLAVGKEPACVVSCPTDALKYEEE